MTVDVEQLFERHAATEVTVVSGTLVPGQATWLDQEVYPSLEEASRAARENPLHAGKVMQMILHIPGGLDESLSREQILEVLKPRREYHVAVRMGLRQARDVIDVLPATLNQIAADGLAHGLHGADSYHQNLRLACITSYRDASRVLILTLVARKGDNAKNRREELASALDDLAARVRQAYNLHVPSSADETAGLESALAAASRRFLLDFDEGFYHSMADKREGSINIGSIGQVAGHIGNGNQGDVRATQTANEASLFRDLTAAVRGGVQSDKDRDRLIEAIEAMERSKGDKNTLAIAYGSFIATAADYISLVSPFLPAIALMIAS